MTSKRTGADRYGDPRWVLALALVLFGWQLGGHDLWAPDEPYFGEGAREMVADGQWLVPHVNGEITTDKPPLFFWLIALFSLPSGAVSSLTARLPSALAALGTLLLAMRLARRTSDSRTAALAGAMLATTYMFWDKARSAQIDSLLAFLILIALAAFEAFRSGEWPGRPAGLVFWAASGLAVLAKGPVGVLLPLGIALITLGSDRDLPSWRRFAPLSGPLVFLAVAGSWAGATMLWGGEYSVWGALNKHFVERGIHGMHHVQPVWYYLQVLPYALLPWSFLLPGALLFAWRRRRQPAERFLLSWALFVVLVFTVSTEKRDLYILPAVPAFALLFARLVAAVAGWWPDEREREGEVPGGRWVTVAQGVFGGVMVLAAVAVPFAAPRFGEALVAPGYGLAAVLAAGGIGVLVAAVRGKRLGAVGWSAGAMGAAMLAAVSFVYPALEPEKSGRELALVVLKETAESRAAGQPVLGLDLGNVPRMVNFYSDGIYLKNVTEPAELLADLSSGAASYLLANEDALPPLPEELKQRMSVVYSTQLSRKDLVLLHFAGVRPTP